MAPSALLTGQPALAAWAACSNPAESRPSTSPLTLSLLEVIVAPLDRSRVTSAVTWRERGVPPALAISFERAIEKHEECAAAMSSSGLVVPPAASDVRLGQETSNLPTP